MMIWGLGFGDEVLDWVFGVALFSLWGLEPVVRGLLGFWGWSSLYKQEEYHWEKKLCLRAILTDIDMVRYGMYNLLS